MKFPSLTSSLKISKPLVGFGLTSLFLLCFVITPLWNSLPGFPLKILSLLLSLSFAFALGWWGSGSVALFSLRDLVVGFGILLVMTILNGQSMLLSIPWRGDEDYHIMYTKQLSDSINIHKIYLLVFVVFALAFVFFKKLNFFSGFVIFVFSILAAFAGYHAHVDLYNVLRYPILLKYLTAILAWFYHYLPLTGFPELPYRILPFISSTILIFLIVNSLPKNKGWMKIAVIVFFVTLPLLRYYSTLFYLEMPAVLCMTLVLLNAQSLLEKPLTELNHEPSWYALVLIGFLKETVLPFVLVFLFWRILFRVIPLLKTHFQIKVLWSELFFFFAVGFPLFLYLLYRMRFGNAHHYQPDFENFLNPTLVKILLRSWWDSFGILIPTAAIGLIILVYHKKWLQLFFLVALYGAISLFHFIDGSLYIGYSRFNLFLLPVLAVLSVEAIRFLSEKFIPVLFFILLMGIGFNYLFSPLNGDGTRKSYWGIYGVDIGEHDYPYRDALVEIQKLHLGNRVRLTGNSYPYRMNFYLNNSDLPQDDQNFVRSKIFDPKREVSEMDSLLSDSKAKSFDAVLYHVTGNSVPKLYSNYGFNSQKVFKNQAHTLVLFTH